MTASNAFGRQVVVALTNKSGGSVAAGDVVYLNDGTNADSFTTGTTSARTGGIGIAQETISNNAAGRILIGGYASLVNVNASVTIGHYGSTYTVAKQATDAGASRAAGTFCQFQTGGTTPDAIIWQPDLGGGSGMTNPMTNSQDIIVGGTAGAPGRLGIGAAGGVLGSLNSVLAYLSGTSNPGSAATGDIYYRSDLNYWIKFDGTRWLTLHEIAYNIGVDNASSTNSTVAIVSPANFDLWVVRVEVATFVLTTNDGTNKWTVTLNKTSTANANTGMGNINTGSDTHDVWTPHTITVGAAVGGSASFPKMTISYTKASAPGNLYFGAVIYGRLIIT